MTGPWVHPAIPPCPCGFWWYSGSVAVNPANGPWPVMGWSRWSRWSHAWLSTVEPTGRRNHPVIELVVLGQWYMLKCHLHRGQKNPTLLWRVCVSISPKDTFHPEERAGFISGLQTYMPVSAWSSCAPKDLVEQLIIGSVVNSALKSKILTYSFPSTTKPLW